MKIPSWTLQTCCAFECFSHGQSLHWKRWHLGQHTWLPPQEESSEHWRTVSPVGFWKCALSLSSGFRISGAKLLSRPPPRTGTSSHRGLVALTYHRACSDEGSRNDLKTSKTKENCLTTEVIEAHFRNIDIKKKRRIFHNPQIITTYIPSRVYFSFLKNKCLSGIYL